MIYKRIYEKILDEYDSEKFIQEQDNYILAKGGDGTLIRAIHMHGKKGKPFFGVAAGTLNFLMNQEQEILSTAVIKKFQLLNVEICTNSGEIIQKRAFNDIIIGSFNGWVDFKSNHDESIIGDFKGAGIIISTAQGSTGANKNNNGTILPLGSKLLSVTGVMTNRRIDHVIENTGLDMFCSSRDNVKMAIDGSYFIADNVKSVKITRGADIELIFNDYDSFKKKRQN